MTSNSPRPLPTRALPPLKTDSTVGEAPMRTPRRKLLEQHNRDGSPSEAGKERRQRPATKKKSPRTTGSADNESGENVTAGRRLPEPTSVPSGQENRPEGDNRPRTKRRRRPANEQKTETAPVNGNLISSMFSDEDVVAVHDVEDGIVLTNLPGVAAGMNSAASDKVYVQTSTGFKSHNQEWLNQRIIAQSQKAKLNYGDDNVYATHIAKNNEKGFMYITLVLHGLLSGMAIWQLVVAYSLLALGENNFLTQYESLAQPTQTTFYIILILCTISAFDRYDLGRGDKNFLKSLIKFDLAAWALILYFLAFAFNVGLAGLDAWLGQGLWNSTNSVVVSDGVTTPVPLPAELTGSELDIGATINSWLVLSVMRTVLVGLGWLLIAVDPLRNDMKWEDTEQ